MASRSMVDGIGPGCDSTRSRTPLGYSYRQRQPLQNHRNSTRLPITTMKRLQILARQSAIFSRLSFNSSLPVGSSTHDRRLSSSVVLHLPQRGSDLYHHGLKIHLQFQAQDTTAFRPLVAKIVKRLEPFTSSAVLLIQQISDSSQFILKLNDRRLGHRHSLNGEGWRTPADTGS